MTTDKTFHKISPGLYARRPQRYVFVCMSIDAGCTSTLSDDLADCLAKAASVHKISTEHENPLYECVYIRDRYTNKTILDLDCTK